MEEQPSQQKPQEEGATMQGSSDCDVLRLCKQLQEIRAQLAKARAKVQVDGTIQDKAAAKLDEVCELLQQESQSDGSTCPKDGTPSENNASTMTEDDAVNAVVEGPASGPSCCAANETVGGDDSAVSPAVIVDTANLDIACETVSTSDYCVVAESPPPAEADGVRNSTLGSSPYNEDHCYAAGTSGGECILPDSQTSLKFIHQSSEKRPAPTDTQTPDAKKLKTVSSVSSGTPLKGQVIVAGARVPSGTPGPVIVRRCILQPAGTNISQTLRNSSLPIASQSRVTMVVKAKDAGKPIRVPVHMYSSSNQQSGEPGKDSPQKLTIVHMKVLQQSPQTSKAATAEKAQKTQKTMSKGCQTTRITRAQTRKKAAPVEVKQEPCTALVKTFPQPDKRKGRRKGKNAMTTQCVVFCCEACGDAFSAAKHLHRHWQTRHRKRQEGKHQCSYCTYSSDRKAHVTMHERTHTGERPFSCYVCQKGFYRADDVETHMRVHTKEKPFECNECGQRFNVSSNLNRHKKLHSDDAEIHACADCGKTFNQKVHLKSHLRTHTGERPYQCSQCNQRFTELGSVRKHERMVHAGDYPHYCPHCGKGLANNFKLKKHLRARHFQFKMEDYVDEEEETPQTAET
nr:GDNF-inducible zinc finger protein 1-like [Dermacentor andersoni]